MAHPAEQAPAASSAAVHGEGEGALEFREASDISDLADCLVARGMSPLTVCSIETFLSCGTLLAPCPGLVLAFHMHELDCVQAETTALLLTGEDSPFANMHALVERMDALEAVLPGIPLVPLVKKDPSVLTAAPAQAIQRLILFDKELGHPHLPTLISVAPQLLYDEVRLHRVFHHSCDCCFFLLTLVAVGRCSGCPLLQRLADTSAVALVDRCPVLQEVEARLAHALTKLASLLPKTYPTHKLQAVLAEAPTLIFRMDYYHNASSLSDLPPDFQQTLLSQ